MNWIRPFALFVIFAFAGTAFSEEMSTKESRWKQLSQAYGFVLGQQISLELIEQEFPNLAKDVRYAWFSFNSTALGESVKGVEEELSKMLGNWWSEYKKEMIAQMDMLIGEQDITRQQAVVFLQEVRQRSRGEMPESILATLLSAHSKFAKTPGWNCQPGGNKRFGQRITQRRKVLIFRFPFPLVGEREKDTDQILFSFSKAVRDTGPLCAALW